jgi:hypothetical protein
MTRNSLADTVGVFICARAFSPALLVALSSVANQTQPQNWAVKSVVVVWNADHRTNVESERRLEDWATENWAAPFPLEMVEETHVGIPHARNKALEVAHSKKLGWIAFLDDDCIAYPHWLFKLEQQAHKHNADVIAGGWEIEPAKTFSPWLPASVFGPKFYQNDGRNIPDGGNLPTAYTRNVVFRRSLAERAPSEHQVFDENLTQSGGSDSLFFYRLLSHGGLAIFAENARVRELYDGERLALTWHVRRRIRNSQQRVLRSKETGESITTVAQGLQSLLSLLIRVPASVFLLPAAPFSHRVKRWIGTTILKSAPHIGLLLLALGIRYQEYSRRFSLGRN